MNWYRFAQSMQQIENIARQVRASLLQDDDDSLKAMCLPVSRHLMKVLIDNGFSAANVVQGTFTVDHPDMDANSEWDIQDFLPAEVLDTEGQEMEYARNAMEAATYTPLHYWVQINNIVVDITADQFNDELDDDPFPEVVVADINTLDRYTTIREDWIGSKSM